MRRRLSTSCLLLLLLLSLGCAVRYPVTVDAMSEAGSSFYGRYVLYPGTTRLQEGDLEFRWVAGHLDEALARRGFERVSRPGMADLVITLAYEIEGPEIFTRVHTDRWYDRFRRRYYYDTYTTQHQVYTRHLVVAAYRAKDYRRGDREQLWRVSARSQGGSADTRGIMPVMIAAMEPYIGLDTQGQRQVWVDAEDERLR